MQCYLQLKNETRLSGDVKAISNSETARLDIEKTGYVTTKKIDDVTGQVITRSSKVETSSPGHVTSHNDDVTCHVT